MTASIFLGLFLFVFLPIGTAYIGSGPITDLGGGYA